MKAIILGGTAGIGLAISKRLRRVCKKVIAVGRKDIDTTSIKKVKSFCKKHKFADVLVLNSGGPENLNFKEITDEIWIENFNKLFLSFVNILKSIKISQKGYVFLISSFIIKEPNENLIISSSLRAGFVSLFKSLSKIYKNKKIHFINIAPGPFKTKRIEKLLKQKKITLKKFEKGLPGQHLPNPDEIGLFVEFVVKNKIRSLNGVTITFDSNLLNHI